MPSLWVWRTILVPAARWVAQEGSHVHTHTYVHTSFSLGQNRINLVFTAGECWILPYQCLCLRISQYTHSVIECQEIWKYIVLLLLFIDLSKWFIGDGHAMQQITLLTPSAALTRLSVRDIKGNGWWLFYSNGFNQRFEWLSSHVRAEPAHRSSRQHFVYKHHL